MGLLFVLGLNVSVALAFISFSTDRDSNSLSGLELSVWPAALVKFLHGFTPARFVLVYVCFSTLAGSACVGVVKSFFESIAGSLASRVNDSMCGGGGGFAWEQQGGVGRQREMSCKLRVPADSCAVNAGLGRQREMSCKYCVPAYICAMTGESCAVHMP